MGAVPPMWNFSVIYFTKGFGVWKADSLAPFSRAHKECHLAIDNGSFR